MDFPTPSQSDPKPETCHCAEDKYPLSKEWKPVLSLVSYHLSSTVIKGVLIWVEKTSGEVISFSMD